LKKKNYTEAVKIGNLRHACGEIKGLEKVGKILNEESDDEWRAYILNLD